MHTVHLVAVRPVAGETPEEAAESLVSESGNPEDGAWWDWFEVGGRWADAFGGPTAIPLNSPEGRKALQGAIDRQNALWRECNAKVRGGLASDDDLNRNSPIPGSLNAEQRAAIAADNARTCNAITHLLAGETIQEGIQSALTVYAATGEGPASEFSLGMWFYNLDKVRNLFEGWWFNDAGFYADPSQFYRPADPQAMLALMNENPAAVEGMFLVIVDFHY